MADTTIDRLQIEIEANAQSAGSGIDKLAASLQKLKDITSSSTGQLTGIQKSLQNLKNTISGMGQDAEGISRLANSMMRLNKVNLDGINGKLGTISKELGNLSITSEIPESMSMLNKGMSKLVNSFNKLDKISLEGNTEKIKRMAEALKPLTDEMLRAGPAAASYGSAIRDLSQALRTANNAGVLTQKLSDSTERLNSSFGKGFKFAGFAVWLRLLKQGTAIIASFIKNTNSYIEDMNLFSVALKDASKEAEIFTQRMEDLLGIDAGEARRNMGLFQNLVTSFGVARDQAYILSKNLTQLGYDISSFYNISSEDAFQKLQSGIAGEIEPLRRLGVDLSQARLQQELFNLGINQSVNNLTQADKSLLRYIAIIKQTGDAQTDFARTLNTPANQLRILQAQLSLAARAIGSVFIPALNAILPPVIAVVKIFRELISTLASLVGFEMPTIEFPQPGSDLGGISGGLEDVAGAAKDAKKEINYLIGGFDELNVLNKQNEVSGNVPGGGVGNSNILDQIKLPEYDMFEGLALNKVDEWVQKIRPLLIGILAVATAIGTAILGWKLANGFIDGLNLVMGTFRFITGKTGGLLQIQAVSEKLAESFQKLGPDTLGWIGTIALGVTHFVTLYATSENFRVGLSRLWEIAKGWGKAIADTIGLLVSGFSSLIPQSVKDAFSSVSNFVSEFLGLFDIKITDAIVAVASFFLPGGKFLLAFEGITLALRGLGAISDETWEGIKQGAIDWWNGVTSFFTEQIPNWWTNDIMPWFTFERWKELFYNIGHAFGDSLKWVVQTWTTTIPNWWETSVKPWFTLQKWIDLFSTISSGIVSAISNLVNNWKDGISRWWENEVKPWFTLEKWKELGKSAIDGLMEGVSGIWDGAKELGGEFLRGIQDSLDINSPSKVMRDEVGVNVVLGMLEGIQVAFSTLTSWFNISIQNWIYSINETYFSKVVWLNTFQNINAAAKEKTNEALNWWKLKINKWWEGYVIPMFQKSKWIGVLGGVTEAFKEINQEILSDFRKTSDELLGYLKSVINDMQEYADRHPIIIEVKTVGRELSGYSLDDSDFYTTKSIREFAGGGVVKSPTVGLIGEYAGARTNPEIVAPQSIIRDTMEEANADVIDVLYQILAAAQEIAQKDTTIELDGEELAKSVNKNNRSRGYNLGIL